jgi:sterol desaturase/sphingolipid hydroxylase (fatty acid hydroxylase superfamily)
MNPVWIALNTIPFLSLFLVKNILPMEYKKRNYISCFFYYYININLFYSYFYDKIIDAHNHHFPTPLIPYLVCFEGVFYIWHRISHISGLYRHLHAHHHINHRVEPIDFIDVDYVDSLGFHTCMHLPLIIIPLHSLEYLTWYFVMTTSGFLLHSDLLGKHHQLHHQYFHYNYCFLIPIFDYTFGTIRL